jgi:hypothetical protein
VIPIIQPWLSKLLHSLPILFHHELDIIQKSRIDFFQTVFGPCNAVKHFTRFFTTDGKKCPDIIGDCFQCLKEYRLAEFRGKGEESCGRFRCWSFGSWHDRYNLCLILGEQSHPGPHDPSHRYYMVSLRQQSVLRFAIGDGSTPAFSFASRFGEIGEEKRQRKCLCMAHAGISNG